MATVARAPKVPDAAQISAEVESVLGSEIFNRAPSLAQFLRYICHKTLAGEAGQIKEYSIAVDAFGRQPDFDQKADAIVRVEAHRLRKRLKQYYETEAAGHPVQIVIPPGQYAPLFVFRPREEKIEPSPPPIEPVMDLIVARPRPGEGTVPVAPRRKWIVSRRAIVIAAVAGIAMIGALLWIPLNKWSVPRAAASSGTGGSAYSGKIFGTPGGEEEGIRIACGLTATYRDSLGNAWRPDRYFTGGQILSSPAAAIQRWRDPALFEARRQGDFQYDIPLAPGVYELHLLFAERVFGTGNIAGGGESSRLFHVYANGLPLVENLDVISDAAGGSIADVKVFKDIRPSRDGLLHLRFTPFKETAFVNGIEILPGVPGKMRPVRLVASGNSVRDASGRLWNPDQYCAGGQIVTRPDPVVNTRAPEVYRSERYGNFSYAIPVAAGRYAVTFYFAENWFGPSKPGGGGAGSRSFDVYCNGGALLKNFDVFQTARRENRAVERTFHGLTPNAQDKLMLSFVPVRNYALVNAIEILPE